MEELFLRVFLASKEVDVVDQQRVDGAVEILEFDLPAVADRRHHLVKPLFGTHVNDARVSLLGQNRVADTMHQMVLPRPDSP